MQTAPGSKPRVLRVAVCGRLDPGLFDLRQGVVLAEVPVAEPHVRELVAAAGNADAAVIVVDGRDEAVATIRRDIHLLALLGVRRLVLIAKEPVALPEALSAMEAAYRKFASRVGLADFHCVAADALAGVLQSTPPAEPAADEPAKSADQFEAAIIWMADAPLLPGRNYDLRLAGRTAIATVAPLRYRIDPETLEHVAASKLSLNEVGVCQIELDRAMPFEPYRRNRELGGFVLVDRMGGETVGAGMLHFELRRSQNVHWQALDIDRKARASLKGQRPCVLWFTGLSGAGKSTIANLVEKKLHAMGRHTYLLDGDNVRHGLNKDLGFTEQARVENIRRVAEVARLMADAGLIVLAAFISPFRSERRMARDLLPPGEFVEVFVDVPLEVAEQRDPKGLYKKARRGDLKNFTGVDSPYESPERPEVRIDTTSLSPEEAAEQILGYLERQHISI